MPQLLSASDVLGHVSNILPRNNSNSKEIQLEPAALELLDDSIPSILRQLATVIEESNACGDSEAAALRAVLGRDASQVGNKVSNTDTTKKAIGRTDSSRKHRQLPPELWKHVFSFLSPLQRLQIMAVCREWRDLIACEQLWQHVRFPEGGTDVSLFPAVRYLTEKTETINVSVEDSDDPDDENNVGDLFLSALAQKSPKLKGLRIERGDVTDSGLALLRNLHLETLSLEQGPRKNYPGGLSPVSWQGLTHACHTTLTSLNLKNCNIDDEAVAGIASSCPSLQDLNLGLNLDISDEGVTHLGQCSHLRSLDLQLVPITGAAFEVIAGGCGELQSLHLKGCRQLGRDALEPFANMPQCNLSTLDITYACNTGDSALSAVLGASHAGWVHLGLAQVDAVNDDLLTRIPPMLMGNLKSLDISGTNVSEDGILHLADVCRQLTSVALRDLGLGPRIARAASFWRQLTSVALDRNDALDNSVLEALTTHCRLVREISLAFTSVTHEATTAAHNAWPGVALRWFKKEKSIPCPDLSFFANEDTPGQ